jgi:hypothetical protein
MKRTLLTVACVIASASLASAQNADIAGRWEVTVHGTQGANANPAPLELRKEGDKFVGVFYAAQGNADVTATVKEKAVTFVLPPFQTQNGPINVSMSGTVDGDTMKGTMDAGGRGTFDWTATRTAPTAAEKPAGQSETKLDVSGTWGLEVTTSQGSGTPTIVLKQEGEKLSGQYTGQLGQAPVTGTIKGSDVTFSFTITVEGNTASIIYAGRVEKDTMKGTVTLGEMGEGTFVGKKK